MYGYNNNFGGYVPPIQQRPMYMPTQPQVQDMEQMTPFQIVRFVNEKEAQAFTLLPNQKALLMDTANMKFWIKWTDSLGNSTTETYKFEKTENGETTKESIPAIDTSKFLTEENLKNVATKEELASLRETIAELKKQVKISQIMSEKPTTTLKGE